MPDQPRKSIHDMTIKELIAESKRLMKISADLTKRSTLLSQRVSELNRKKK
jgi:hypothetical protein